MKRIEGIWVEPWEKGACIMVCNSDCRGIVLHDGARTETTIAVESVPFVHFCEGIPQEYRFLTAKGEEL